MTAPFIIVEGPDGAGKSAFVDYLVKQRWQATHFGPYPGELKIFHRYLAALNQVAIRRQRPQVFDRSWFSEQVYGPVLRGRDRLGPGSVNQLERVALGLNGVVVLCLPPWDTVCTNFMRTRAQQLPRSLMELGKIYHWYEVRLGTRQVTCSNVGLRVVVHNYLVDDPLTTLQRALGLSEQHRNRGPGLGAFKPGVTLVVGDQVSPRAPHRERNWPFVADTGCSPWFTDKLLELDVNEGGLYWVNARDHRDKQTKAQPWYDLLQPRRVLALGEVARRWCRQQLPTNAPVVLLEHPQHRKRFHHHRPWLALRHALAPNHPPCFRQP
jgi:hypothetical protein